jgi:hypothetical protein
MGNREHEALRTPEQVNALIPCRPSWKSCALDEWILLGREPRLRPHSSRWTPYFGAVAANDRIEPEAVSFHAEKTHDVGAGTRSDHRERSNGFIREFEMAPWAGRRSLEPKHHQQT